MANSNYDVVVVGGGSAGCALASRLSEDPACRVLLIERGPDPQPIPPHILMVPMSMMALTMGGGPHAHPNASAYPTTRSADGSPFAEVTGRVLGGSSSINFMIAGRGLASDYDDWAKETDGSWSFDSVLPLFKRIETDADYGETAIHGGSGPLFVKRNFRHGAAHGWATAFVDACAALGFPKSDDLNDPAPFGIMPFANNMKELERQSTAVAYIAPARGRPNLTIVADAAVVGLEMDRKRVTGVRYVQEGKETVVHAGETVLCAGTYHSPQILMLAGIGPSAELSRLGIPVRVGLEGVGKNFQDHAVVRMDFEWHSQEMFVGLGAILVAKSGRAGDKVDIHVMQRMTVPQPNDHDPRPMGRFAVAVLEQRTRGRLVFETKDPLAPPAVENRMLDHEDDVGAVVDGMRMLAKAGESAGMRAFCGGLMRPTPDEDWAAYARKTYLPYYHGAGTCRMGRSDNPAAVVDGELRVLGIENLRIADASVMPSLVRGHPCVPTIMIAERCADLVRGARR